MSASASQPVALLIARSLNKAAAVAIKDFGWRQIAQDRFRTPEGEEVHLVADRSSGFLGRPMGTPAYLLPSWSQRDDWFKVDQLLQMGCLVRKPLPNLITR